MRRPTRLSESFQQLRVVTAAQAAARDRAAIDAGTPSRLLMQRAGTAAASEITRRFGSRLARGVLVLAGPGNNGGDAWVVAATLAASGVRVRVLEPIPARTPDACAERAAAVSLVEAPPWSPDARLDGTELVVDGLLGTGARGEPRGEIAEAIALLAAARAEGAVVVALDLPSGLDADAQHAGAAHGTEADLTLSFGSIKRGHLVARERCGEIVALDIGLGAHAALDDGAPVLVDASWVRARVPSIAADAHKGTRKRLVIVGGAEGMAGAALLAGRAALRSGIGMLKLLVGERSLPVVQGAEPLALASAWPATEAALSHEVVQWADAVVLGPGLGNTAASRELVERVLEAWRGPVLLDADALNVFAGDAPALRALLEDRCALLTPHPAECARLLGTDVADVVSHRYEVGARLAEATGATVLLKGVPSVISNAGGALAVSASGNPVLAAAGSGDVLCGIAGTLLAQIADALAAGAAGAWVHGRAAELSLEPHAAGGERFGVRGTTLDDVLHALRDAWPREAAPLPSPVLAQLPAVGD